MPRPLRLQDAGFLHHVISRGNDRQVLFKSRIDCLKYLDYIEEARQLYPVKIYNFVLMDNHVHLLIEPTEDGSLSKFMERVSKSYAKYFNRKYDHVGHVFQGRFKSFLVQSERYFFACSRYIDLNPVKAKMCKDPKTYVWCGHNFLGYGGKVPIKLDLHELYKDLGLSPSERRIAYRALVFSMVEDNLNLLDRRAGVLGDREFKGKLKVKGR